MKPDQEAQLAHADAAEASNWIVQALPVIACLVCCLIGFIFFVPAHRNNDPWMPGVIDDLPWDFKYYGQWPGGCIFLDCDGCGDLAAWEVLELESTHVTVNVSGNMAHTKIRQIYTSLSEQSLDGSYVFAASTHAAIYRVDLMVGGRTVRAQIFTKDQARELFEAAKADGKTAVLLDQNRPNVLVLSLGQIQPFATVAVDIHYTEGLVPSDAVYEVVVPMVVAPRYGGQDTTAESTVASEGGTLTVEVSVTTPETLAQISAASMSHGTAVWDQISPTQAMVTFHTVLEATTGDFIVRYSMAGGDIMSGLVVSEDAITGETFFALTIEPPSALPSGMTPPREYVFVVDVSGSMYGYPLDTSRALMDGLLRSLGTDDIFNVVLFAGEAGLFSASSVAASLDNINHAFSFMSSRRAGGGTDLHTAFRAVDSIRLTPGMARVVVVMTDGLVSHEAAVFEHIRATLSTTNYFAFGIGVNSNRYLIDGIAAVALSEATYVTQESEASTAAGSFRRYIETPVLTGITVETPGGAFELEPPTLPDVFMSRPIVLTGQWSGPYTGSFVVRGSNGFGPKALTVSVENDITWEQNNGTATRNLWARRRVAALEYAGSEDDFVEIERIGLRYSLLTSRTSFLAIDDTNITSSFVDSPPSSDTGAKVATEDIGAANHGATTLCCGFFMRLAIGIPAFFCCSSMVLSFFRRRSRKRSRTLDEEVQAHSEAELIDDELIDEGSDGLINAQSDKSGDTETT